MKKFNVFIQRMKKLGITVECISNFPWIYVYKINGKRVKELFHSEHGWVIGYTPWKVGTQFEFTNIEALFKLIRKYK